MTTSRLLTPFLCLWLAGLGGDVAQAQSPSSKGGYHPYVGDVNLRPESYDLGFNAGRTDAARGLSRDPRRHFYRVPLGLRDEMVAGYNDGYRPPAAKPEDAFGPETYKNGQRYGREDARQGLSNNYRRYRQNFKPKFEQSFREGYELGWRDNYRPAPQRPQPQEQDSTAAIYRRGHQAGANDARNGLSPYPDRHENLYTTRTAKIFREGYADGYHRRRSVY